MSTTISPVRHLVIEDGNLSLQTKKGKAWNNFQPKVEHSGDASYSHDAPSQTLTIHRGHHQILLPQRCPIHFTSKGGNSTGVHPNGQLQVQGGTLQFQAPCFQESSELKGIFSDLGGILSLCIVISLLLSPIFTPPQHLSYIVIASSSLYLGFNGSSKRSLFTSLSIASIALVLPILDQWKNGSTFEFEGSLSYALKIGLYLLLWGAGKKIKDAYRGSVI
jgi:hypothetical protein